MTKKHLNPLEDPPTASSSDDDVVETSEEDDSSSEEDEPIKIPSAAVKITFPAKSPAAEKQVSDSDSGTETETDSNSETTAPPNSGSGIAASSTMKPKEDPTSSTTLALAAVKSGTKRPASDGAASRDVKRGKKGTSGEEESTKKPAFQRLWSVEDEIAVLQGIIDFKADTGKSFYEDTNGFYEFIKKSISFEVSKNQFMDKIRGLKKKYMGKEVKNGLEPSFSKAHDKNAFGLSKSIWGPGGIARESSLKSNGVSKKSQSKSNKQLDSAKQELLFVALPNDKKLEDDGNKELIHGGALRKSDWFENSFLVRSIVGFGVDEYSLKQRWSLVPIESKKMIEEKLKLLQAKELEFVLAKTHFLHEVTSMIVEVSKH